MPQIRRRQPISPDWTATKDRCSKSCFSATEYRMDDIADTDFDLYLSLNDESADQISATPTIILEDFSSAQAALQKRKIKIQLTIESVTRDSRIVTTPPTKIGQSQPKARSLGSSLSSLGAASPSIVRRHTSSLARTSFKILPPNFPIPRQQL
jgi:hypothetical protein